MKVLSVIVVVLCCLPFSCAWTVSPSLAVQRQRFVASGGAASGASSGARRTLRNAPVLASTSSLTTGTFTSSTPTLEQLKLQILQLGAALDRGQSYNPTSGEQYRKSMDTARSKILDLLEQYPNNVPKTLDDIQGEWELVLSTVKHGIFRSSPFFLAVQEAFSFAEEKEAFGEDKATLFFKLHELQTCSWGVSKIGRVAQQIDPKTGYLYSEFDTSIFSLTVIPILGWFKLLPTFGGCVITAAKCISLEEGLLKMEVDYTTSRPVEGLSGLGEWIWSVKVPVGDVWKLLPWNKGRPASCSVFVKYVDDDFRIVEDPSGDLFVYTRPVLSRPLDLIEN
ncbi:hypothetical protein MHU86_7700 [Fragilaria crotonensis]|nr:hypothetical protein MHU86_7700 [Fragilaria crotonensis]